MAGDGYYPEYYLRKRKRDRAYSIVSQIVGALVVFGGLGVLTVFLLFQFVINPRRSQAGVTPEMADARQELSTEQKLAEAASEHVDAPPAVDQKAVDLSQIQYADSMPATSVAIQGVPTSDSTSPAVSEPENTSEDADLSDVSSASNSIDTPPPAAKSSDAAAPSNQEQRRAEAERKADKKPEERKPEKKSEPKELPKKPVEKPAQEPKPEPVKVESTVYRVYAGSAQDKDAADEMKSRLAGMGYGGTVIKSGPEYLILVDTVEDFDKARALSGELQGRGFSSFTTRSKSKK